MSTENLYQTPEAELVSTESETLPYYTVSITKLIILSLLTLNIYSIYWHYKHWQQQKLSAGIDCIPVLRGIFQIFFVFSLFSCIRNEAESKKISVSWSSDLLALIYVVATIASNIMVRLFGDENVVTIFDLLEIAFTLVLIIPMVFVQRSANAINNDPQGIKNNSFTWINWIFVLIGLALWGLIILGFVLA